MEEVYNESKDSTPLISTQSESDFVLVWSGENDIDKVSGKKSNAQLRGEFLEKVKERRLRVEERKEGKINYAWITADDTEVLEQYAEILKLRMPLKRPVKDGG